MCIDHLGERPIDDRNAIDMFNFMLDYAGRRKIDKNMKELADNLLKIAKDDLDACEIMYNKKKYAKSTNFLQQSVEKASKAYAIYSGNFSKKEIKSINHNTLDAFVRLLEKLSGYVDIIHSMYPDMKTDTTDLKDLIKDNEKRLELAKADYKAFQVIFNMYDSIIQAFSEKMEDICSLIQGVSLQNSLKEGLQGVSDDVSDYVDGKDNKEIIEQYCDVKGIKEFLKDGVDLSMLYILAGFTFPHAQYTRYPDNELKPSDYTLDLGIVKATPELITHLKRIIDKI